MRWPWSRKTDTDTVPAEIQEYYQTERRERTGIAWLLALGTLVVTIILASIIFLGGRWIYRTLTDDNNNGQTSQDAAVDQPPNNQAPQNGNNEGSAGQPDGTPQPPSGSGDSGGAGNGGTNGGSTDGSQAPSAQAPATTPATGDLPDTGPGDVLAIFVVTATAGAIVHYVISARRSDS